MKKSEINIKVENEKLFIDITPETPTGNDDVSIEWIRNGIAHRNSNMSWTLSQNIDKKNIEVFYNDGIIKVVLPIQKNTENTFNIEIK